jgi:phosphate transport system permease protein
MRKGTDLFFRVIIYTSAGAAVVLLLGIFFMLFSKGAGLFREVSPAAFLSGLHWSPSDAENPRFGIAGMLLSTGMVTFGAMLMAVPVGVATAACIAELAPVRIGRLLKAAVELLAGIPSVVVGFVGIEVVGPFLQSVFHLPTGFGALNGSILLAVMALPTIVSLSEDAIHSVPGAYKEASRSLGANAWQTLLHITLPACRSGILSAVVLGLGRAIGETMTVLMVTGNATALPSGFFDSVRTLTATIAIELGEVAYDTTHYYSLFAIGAVLFVITLLFNILAEWAASKMRVKQQL